MKTEKSTKTKKKKKKSLTKTEQEEPQDPQVQEEPKWRRITIRDVEHDEVRGALLKA